MFKCNFIKKADLLELIPLQVSQCSVLNVMALYANWKLSQDTCGCSGSLVNFEWDHIDFEACSG